MSEPGTASGEQLNPGEELRPIDKLYAYVYAHVIGFRRAEAPSDTDNSRDVFFLVVQKHGEPSAEELRSLIENVREGAFCNLNPLDGAEHNFLSLGAWIGAQEAALCLMGLGSLLGLWQLLTPRSMFGELLSEEAEASLAGNGGISIRVSSV